MGSFAVTPVIAGLVIDLLGPGGAYLISSIGNVALLIALLMLTYAGSTVRKEAEPVLESLRIGVRFSRRHSMIPWIILVSFVTGALAFSLYMGIIAKWAGSVLDLTPGEYGLLAATWGLGTLAASVCLSYVDVRRPGKIFAFGSILFGASFLIFGLARDWPIVIAAYIVNGAAWTAASITSTSIIQRVVPNEVRGRVMSLFMLNGAIAQMNSLVLGLLADIITLEVLLPVTTGLCTVIVTGLFLAVPALKAIDRRLEATLTAT
jgi:MFS family permease